MVCQIIKADAVEGRRLKLRLLINVNIGNDSLVGREALLYIPGLLVELSLFGVRHFPRDLDGIRLTDLLRKGLHEASVKLDLDD